MASTSKCSYCGATMLSTDSSCPQCGAPNPGFQETGSSRQIFHPRTIGELRQYCQERNMPLLRMRFFIGEDFREPRAFGIYEDNGRYIVYKNKSDGTRAVRYQGSDEEHAVEELFQKLLEECHMRGIYPDGKPEQGAVKAKKRNQALKAFFTSFAVILVLTFGTCGYSLYAHRNDGYYQFHDSTVYYHYGDDWYCDSGYYDWVETDPPAYEGDVSEYFLGEDYTSDWGVSDFRESALYEELHESSSSSSSDYDSWDSSDTDWDSDW